MTPFRFQSQPGKSIVDQVVFAATRAFVNGEMGPGEPFPSVRALAADLKIHPNTAHKVVQHLIREGWLITSPGIGTVVAEVPDVKAAEAQRLLEKDVERLVGEARRLGLAREDLARALDRHWNTLEKPEQ